MNEQQEHKILESLGVAFEVMGQDMSETAVEFIANELYRHDFNAVQKAIKQACRECKYKINLAEIESRIDDGRPSPMEAWQAMHQFKEADAYLVPDEMHIAWCTVSTAMEDADQSTKIACRQAFLERYEKLTKESREQGVSIKYTLSRPQGIGSDQKVLEVINKATNEGLITKKKAIGYLPHMAAEIEQGIMIEHKPESDITGLIGGVAENMRLSNE